MCFFGLTSLGPDNPFTAYEANHPTLHLFTEEDWIVAWKKVGGGVECDDTIPSNKLLSLLEALHHGPAPPWEVIRLQAEIGINKNTISWHTLRQTFLRIQSEAEPKMAHQYSSSVSNTISNNKSSEQKQRFKTYQDFHNAIRRHEVSFVSTSDNDDKNDDDDDDSSSSGEEKGQKVVLKLQKPMTTNQVYGWKKEGESDDDYVIFRQKIRARNSCPETKYANHLVKSGLL